MLTSPPPPPQQQQDQERIINATMTFYNAIVNQHALDKCWLMKPYLNGRDIIQLFHSTSASTTTAKNEGKGGKKQKKGSSRFTGPMIGTYMEKQIQWMLVHPHGTKVECE